MASEKQNTTSNIFSYVFIGSALFIGVVLMGYIAILFLNSIGINIWVATLLYAGIVAFVLSAIYVCLDLGYVIKQKFLTKKENKENISVPSDVITSEVPTDEVFSNKDTTSTSAPISIKEEEALFTKRYVAEAHKNSHIYEIIKSMEDIGHGGQFFVRVLRIAKTLGWIHMIPPYKDALMIFGESFIGKESNYNTQLNNDDSDEEKKYEIRKTLKNKFDCVQNKYPKEVPSTNES